MRSKRNAASIAFAAITAVAGVSAHAATPAAYPSKPIRLVTGYPPGGNVDITARVIAASFNEQFGQPVIVDNRPAVHGVISGLIVSKAAPDGYTLLVASSGQITAPSEPNPDMTYDYVRDFAAIGMVQAGPYILASSARSPVARLNLAELFAYSRERPGKVTVAYSGIATRLALELMNTMVGIRVLPVPYKGAGPAVTETIGGQVDTTITQLIGAIGALRDNRLRGLAVTTMRRSSVTPNIPTFDESGLKGFEAATFVGVLAPAATPPAIVKTLNAAIAKIVATPSIQERFRDMGSDTIATTPEQFSAMIRRDIEKWKKVAQAAGIKGE